MQLPENKNNFSCILMIFRCFNVFNVIFRFVQLFLFEILINGLLMAPLIISKISKVNSVNKIEISTEQAWQAEKLFFLNDFNR